MAHTCSSYQYCLGLCLVSAFPPPQQQSAPSAVLTVFLSNVDDAPVRLPGSNDPPRGMEDRGNHGTAMKDDEWLIKEERVTLNVMAALSGQSKQA